MERENVNTPLHTGYAIASDEWSWFHSNRLFAADPLSTPPRDMGSWCHQPFEATAVNNGGGLAVNKYGPAMSFPNTHTAFGFGHGWLWNVPSPYVQTGTDPAILNWTIALGWSKTVAAQTNIMRITHLFNQPTGDWLLSFNPGTGNYGWATNVGTLLGAAGASGDVLTDGNTVVIVTRGGRDTVMYADGAEVASAAWGWGLNKLRFMYAGTDFLQRPNVSLGGTIGPLILSRGAWSADQAAQWAANPWGWLAPAWVPQPRLYSPLIADVGVRAAVAGDVQARAAVAGDAQARPTVAGDAQARPAVAGDVQARPAVVGDVAVRPEE